MRGFTAVLLTGVLTCLGASCASGGGATHILNTGELFSAADWTPDLETAVSAAGWSARADAIKAHLNEKTGWPTAMADEDKRWLQQAMIARYSVVEVARLTYYGQPAVLLHVPAAANQHMPEGWKPVEDFFIVVSEAAMSEPPH